MASARIGNNKNRQKVAMLSNEKILKTSFRKRERNTAEREFKRRGLDVSLIQYI